MMDVLYSWLDLAGRRRSHGARVSDAFGQAAVTSLATLVQACSLAGLQTGGRIDTSLDIGDTAVDGAFPSVHQRIELVFDGLGTGDVTWDILAPNAAVIQPDGTILITAPPMVALIEYLQVVLRTPTDGLVGGLKAARLIQTSSADRLIQQSARLPGSVSPAVDFWPDHGCDIVAGRMP